MMGSSAVLKDACYPQVLSERLDNQIKELKYRLEKLEAAKSLLDKNPDIKKTFDLLSELGV